MALLDTAAMNFILANDTNSRDILKYGADKVRKRIDEG